MPEGTVMMPATRPQHAPAVAANLPWVKKLVEEVPGWPALSVIAVGRKPL